MGKKSSKKSLEVFDDLDNYPRFSEKHVTSDSFLRNNFDSHLKLIIASSARFSFFKQ